MTFNRSFLVGLASTLAVGASSAATVFSFPDFSSTAGLTLNGNAAIAAGNVLRVTPATDWQAGSAFSTSTVSLSNAASFSTYFQFRFTNPDRGSCDGTGGPLNGCGADGLVFVVQPVSNNVGASGGGIGYQGIPTSLGIEFDSWFNSGFDSDSNHVGININGNINSVRRALLTEADLNAGDIWNAWVDYNGDTDLLEVRAGLSSTRPTAALLSYTVDLAGVLGTTNAYVGFTSGTGTSHANHDVLSWQLNNDFSPIDPGPGNNVSEPGTLLLAALSMAALGLRRRKA